MIVKICGITTVEDARYALGCGADWIGLNLVAGPRRIEISAAVSIAAQLPDPSRAVALTAFPGATPYNPPLRRGEANSLPADLETLRRAGVLRLQVYGAVTAEVLGDLNGRGFETILVHPLADEASFDALENFLARCGDRRPDYVLFDAPSFEPQAEARGSSAESQALRSPRESGTISPLGGTGRRANWMALADAYTAGRYAAWPPILLAGGLTPHNVGEAIRVTHPVGVDVSSGVEMSPGRKDPEKVTAFVRAARGLPNP